MQVAKPPGSAACSIAADPTRHKIHRSPFRTSSKVLGGILSGNLQELKGGAI